MHTHTHTRTHAHTQTRTRFDLENSYQVPLLLLLFSAGEGGGTKLQFMMILACESLQDALCVSGAVNTQAFVRHVHFFIHDFIHTLKYVAYGTY